jgi:ankyrin repeat protein
MHSQRGVVTGIVVGVALMAGMAVTGLVGVARIVNAGMGELVDSDPCLASVDPVVIAAASGDLAGLRRELDDGAPVEGADRRARPLHCAIKRQQADTAIELLNRGADPNHPQDLTLAATGGLVPVVESLLTHGARPDDALLERVIITNSCAMAWFGNAGGQGLSRVATDEQVTATVKLLLEHGASAAGARGARTPLLAAAYSGRVEVARLLLERGAPVDRGGPVNRLELEAAAAQAQGSACWPVHFPQGSYERFRADPTTGMVDLPGGGTGKPLFPIEYLDGDGVSDVSPLTAAALAGHLEMARLLLDHGADPNAVAGGMVTPLYCAATRGDIPMIRLLIERGAAPVPAVDPRVMTPEEVATKAGFPEAAEIIAALSGTR